MTDSMLMYRDPVSGEFIPYEGGGGGVGAPNAGAPIGTVVSYVGSEAPEGWHLCDGTAHGSAALAELIGSPNAPDLRGRFLLAASAGHAAGQTGGAETHTLTEAEMPHHSHEVGFAPPGDGIAVAAVQQKGGGTFGGWGVEPGDTSGVPDFLRRWLASGKGGNGAHNNMPPFYAIVFIIKTFTDAIAEHGFTREEATAQFVDSTGDTMTGALNVLEPSAPEHATPKGYVDEVVTVSELNPVGPPSRDGLLWIVVEGAQP